MGVVISSDGKVAKQCAEAVKKGFMVLGMISRTFVSRRKKVIEKLYKSLVRPKLDYCIQAWRPHLKRDIDLLERVQRRATRMVEECRGMDYEGRLRYVKLTALKTRRIRADLVEVYKIINGKEGLLKRIFLEEMKVARVEIKMQELGGVIDISCIRRDSGLMWLNTALAIG